MENRNEGVGGAAVLAALRLDLERCRGELAACQGQLAIMKEQVARSSSSGQIDPLEAGQSESLISLREDVCRLAGENEQLREDLSDLFDEAPIPYVYEGLDTRFIRANRAALDVLGIDESEITKTFGNSFVADSPGNLGRLQGAFDSVGQGREYGGVVLELRRKDNGRPVWVQWWSRPTKNGKYTRTMMLDITERVLMEQTKAELEFTLASGQVGEWDLNLTNGTSRRSFRHDQCFGYSSPVPEDSWSVETFIEHVHPEDRLRVEESFRLATRSFQRWECEFRVIWTDGSVHWIDARGSVYGRHQGVATRMLGLVMDITDRKRAEEVLFETKASLEFALSSAKIGDWDLDLTNDTSRRSLRHDQCFGYDEPIPDTEWGVAVFVKHLHPQDRDRVETSLREAASRLQGWQSEFRVIWPDGSLHWLAARGSIYRTKEGVATRMLGIVMDISERKRAEEALAASEKLARGQVEAMARTLDALARETLPDRLLEHVLRTVIEQLGAHSCSVWRRHDVLDRAGFEYALEDGHLVTKGDESLNGTSLWLSRKESLDVFRTGKHNVIPDIRRLPFFPLQERLASQGVITILIVPMSGSGKVEAAIGIRFTQLRTFNDDEVALARALANQAMLALQLTRMAAQSREAAVLEERNRMARDIHDTLAQGFTGVIVQLEAAEDARLQGLPAEAVEHQRRARSLARDSLNEARRSVQALRPQALEKYPLTDALKGMLAKMTAGTSLNAELVRHGKPRPLPQDWEEHILRITQEVLTNAIRHAQATTFKALITFEKDLVSLQLQDHGRGFDQAQETDGFGLIGIKERVHCMGGQIDVQSVNGVGTTVVITLPLASPTTGRIEP